MPGAFPQSASPEENTPTQRTKRTKIAAAEQTTPKRTTPIKPAAAEMHPEHHHNTTAKPLGPEAEARWLGFSNMAPHTEPAKKHTSKIAVAQATPTKALEPPAYQFTFCDEKSLDLSPEARKLMQEKRDEALQLREQMRVQTNTVTVPTNFDGQARRLAQPKGRVGRFSDVHMAQFKKMDSIANHASSFRKDPARLENATAGLQRTASKADLTEGKNTEGGRSLKRSPSKAQLDEQLQPSAAKLKRNPSKASLIQATRQLPRSTSSKDMTGAEEPAPPAKRAKRAAGDDATTTRPLSSDGSKPATPQTSKTLRMHPSNPHLVSNLTTPTQASLARAASVKEVHTSKIPAPFVQSPSKATLMDGSNNASKDATPLLARSPSKASLFAIPNVEKPNAMMAPLLARTPAKSGAAKEAAETEHREDAPQEPKVPFLARSPMKMSVAERPEGEDKPSSIPFLARSPSKMSLANNPFDNAQNPAKAASTNLMGRFNLLRASPMKSILRSPQRLYSDDPKKVAAGTHLATPPRPNSNLNKSLPAVPPATAPVHKRVDFTTSTKEREATKSASSTPSKGPTPPPKGDAVEKSPASNPTVAGYPSLPSLNAPPTPSPFKRRQTVTPGDFTFRAGEGITFSQSPNAPASASTRRPSIRHVSTSAVSPIAPATGSKKRKFDFENDMHAQDASPTTSDKENAEEEEEHRPAKRVKSSAPEVPPKTVTTKIPTVGVKPKKGAAELKDKRPSMLSQARLNMLAMPKRRRGE